MCSTKMAKTHLLLTLFFFTFKTVDDKMMEVLAIQEELT